METVTTGASKMLWGKEMPKGEDWQLRPRNMATATTFIVYLNSHNSLQIENACTYKLDL